MKHLVFVESNTTGTGRLAVTRPLAEGHRVTFLTRDPAKYPFLREHASAVAVVVTETNDVDVVAAEVERLQRADGVDALLTFSEFYVAIVAEVGARCRLRALDSAAAVRCRHKPSMRRALRAAGEAVPDFWEVGSEAEMLAAVAAVRYPCVVKPPADSSSFGVRLARGPEEALTHCARLCRATHNVRGQALDGRALIESVLDGPEYSVETVTEPGGDTHVIGVTAKHLLPPPVFVEIGHDFPAALPDGVAREIAAAAVRALAAVGFDLGPAHTEVRLTRDGPVVVEINPRLAGGMIPELVKHATGIDLLKATIDLALGRTLTLTPSRREIAAIRFLTAPCAGWLTEVGGGDAVRGLEFIREMSLPAEPLEVRPAESAYDRLGWIIASGPDRERVTGQATQALALIALEIQPSAAVDAT